MSEKFNRVVAAGIALVAVLTLASCSDGSEYRFTPDEGSSQDNKSAPLEGCGVVEYVETDGWGGYETQSVGRVCVVEEGDR